MNNVNNIPDISNGLTSRKSISSMLFLLLLLTLISVLFTEVLVMLTPDPIFKKCFNAISIYLYANIYFIIFPALILEIKWKLVTKIKNHFVYKKATRNN